MLNGNPNFARRKDLNFDARFHHFPGRIRQNEYHFRSQLTEIDQGCDFHAILVIFKIRPCFNQQVDKIRPSQNNVLTGSFGQFRCARSENDIRFAKFGQENGETER